MKFIKYPITVQYGRFSLSIYEKLSCSIEIIKSYIESQVFDNKKLDSEVMNDLNLKDFNVNIIYNQHNRFNKNLKNIFIEVNIEETIKELEKSSVENFIHSIFDITNKFNIDTIVEIRKLEDSKTSQKYYKSNLYIRLKQSRELKLNIKKNQKLMNIKLFLKSNQDLILNITDPSNFLFKDISLNRKLKKFKIQNVKLKLYEQDKNEININLKSEKFIEKGIWTFKFNKINKSDCAETEFMISEKMEEREVYLDMRDFPKAHIDSSKFEPVFIVYYYPKYEEQLKTLDNIFKFYKLSDGMGIVFIQKDRMIDLGRLYSFTYIYKMQRYIKMVQLTNLSKGIENGYTANEEIGVNYFKTNPNVNLDGRGVIISIVNSGIDYLHPDFIYPDGTSKILYLWDQTKEGNPPEGFNIGTEYTREDINKAIAEKNPNLSTDEEGIGTALGGICAGLGSINKSYAGVAEGADLIVVKLKKIDGFYNNGTFLSGIDYSYKKSKKLDMPIVQNITLGSNNLVSPGIGFMDNDLFYEYRVCEVAGAGNEGNGKTHTMGKISFAGDVKEIEIEIAEYEKEIEIDLWVDKPDKLNLLIISPSGEESKTSLVSNLNVLEGLFDFENTYYSIWSTYPLYYSGQQTTIINLQNVSKGIWKIRLIGASITNGVYHIYLPNNLMLNPGTKFRDGNPNYTLTYPSIYKDSVTVGTYNSLNSSIWAESSRGPVVGNIGRVESPDIVAPGVNIIAPYENDKYALVSGSGVSASYTSGAIALIMQYILFKENYKDKSVVQKIKTYLRSGAKRDSKISYPDASYGYGVLNIKNTFDQIK
ncbi:S8 family peptidase [Bacillus sp. BAU-SS-2023]|nr:S8 family peptidase [Bacillus sp. BAU-SS-2023]